MRAHQVAKRLDGGPARAAALGFGLARGLALRRGAFIEEKPLDPITQRQLEQPVGARTSV